MAQLVGHPPMYLEAVEVAVSIPGRGVQKAAEFNLSILPKLGSQMRKTRGGKSGKTTEVVELNWKQ